MDELHVIDLKGETYKGAEAFRTIWQPVNKLSPFLAPPPLLSRKSLSQNHDTAFLKQSRPFSLDKHLSCNANFQLFGRNEDHGNSRPMPIFIVSKT